MPTYDAVSTDRRSSALRSMRATGQDASTYPVLQFFNVSPLQSPTHIYIHINHFNLQVAAEGCFYVEVSRELTATETGQLQWLLSDACGAAVAANTTLTLTQDAAAAAAVLVEVSESDGWMDLPHLLGLLSGLLVSWFSRLSSSADEICRR